MKTRYFIQEVYARVLFKIADECFGEIDTEVYLEVANKVDTPVYNQLRRGITNLLVMSVNEKS